MTGTGSPQSRVIGKECSERVYRNAGNAALLRHVPPRDALVLDIGCGAGDNAARLQTLGARVHGLTLSERERALAAPRMEECWVGDIESEALPAGMVRASYDAIILSHVLEHLRHPARVVSRVAQWLRPGGRIVIAVPNVLNWRQRYQFVRGRFEYTDTGVMDRTHLHFFTYATADRYLFAETPQIRLVAKEVEGSVPLGPLRRRLLPHRVRRVLDGWGTHAWPNLFGGQVILVGKRAD